MSLLLLIYFSVNAHAEGNDASDLGLYSKTAINKSQILMGLELSTLDISSTQVYGLGARFGFEFALDPRWSILPSLALVASTAGNTSLLYTGLGAELRYSVFGTYQSSRSDIYSHEKLLKSELSLPTQRLSLALGLDQLFLNGTSQIYPASGITIGAMFSFQAFSNWFEVSLKKSLLRAQDKTINAAVINLSFLVGT